MLQRLRFHDIFRKESDGSLTPKRVINVNGITFGPGVAFGEGVSFGGVNFFEYEMYDIATEEINGVFVIKGFYKRNKKHYPNWLVSLSEFSNWKNDFSIVVSISIVK